MRSKVEFFLAPRNSEANEILAKYLESEGEERLAQVQGAVKVYPVTQDQLDFILKSRGHAGLHIRLFRSVGGDILRALPLDYKKRQAISNMRRKIKRRRARRSPSSI